MILAKLPRLLRAVAVVSLGIAAASGASAENERIREKANELEQQLQSRMHESQVKGKTPNTLRVYKDFAFILNQDKVKEVRSESSDPRREQLAKYLEERIVGLELATYMDDQDKHDLAGTGDLDGEPHTQRQLLSRLATEEDPAVRRKIYTVLKPMIDTSNIFRNQIVVRRNELYQEAGYDHYADFYAKREGADLADVEARARAFLTESQELYDMLFEAIAEERMGVKARKVKFYDLPFLGMAPSDEAALSADTRRTRLTELLNGLGLPELAPGNLDFDAEVRPGRYSQGVYPVVVPGDVRVGVTPRGGLRDDRDALFYLGQAGFYALSKQSHFEEARLVNEASAATLGYLVRSVLDEPGWLQSSGISPEDVEIMRRYRAFERLLEIRLLAAQVVFEKALYSDQPDAESVFKDMMAEATGTRLSSTDAGRNLEFAEQLKSAGRFQGLLAAESLRSHLRSKLGDDWYMTGKAGETLKGWYALGGTVDLGKLLAEAGGPESSAVIEDIQGVK